MADDQRSTRRALAEIIAEGRDPYSGPGGQSSWTIADAVIAGDPLRLAVRKMLKRHTRHTRNPLADLPADDPNRTYHNCDPICVECGGDWPCEVADLAALTEETQGAE